MKKLVLLAISLFLISSLFSQRRWRPWQDKFYVQAGYSMPIGDFPAAFDTALNKTGDIYGVQAEAGGLFIIRNFELGTHLRFGLDINASFQRNWKIYSDTATIIYPKLMPGTGVEQKLKGVVDTRYTQYLNLFGVKAGPTFSILPAKHVYFDFFIKAYIAAGYWGNSQQYKAPQLDWKDLETEEEFLPEMSSPTIKPCFGFHTRINVVILSAEFSTKTIHFQETPTSDVIEVPTSTLNFAIGINI